jgi:imidazolonepropionase-like amidohydrolase
MSHRVPRPLRLTLLCLLASLVADLRAAELLPPGFRPLPLGVHALVGGKVVIKPGETLDEGTIVIRDGYIRAVGKDVALPADARVWDMKGTVIYAGFMEPYFVATSTNAPVSTTDSEPVAAPSLTSPGVKFYGVPGVQTDMGNPGPGYEIARITPEYRAVRDYSPKDKTLAPMREIGFTTALLAPSKGIIRGTSALIVLSEENPNQVVLKPDVFQHVAFDASSGEDRSYPGSLMGVIATVRQSFFDARHYALDHADYEKHPQNRPRPEFDPALEALRAAGDKKMRVMFEPGSALMVDRAARVAAELGLDFCIVSCRQEWRRPDLAKTTGASFIVPLDFPTLPKLPNDDDWQQVSLDQLRAWDWAPEDAALLRQQGLEIALSTYGLSDKKKFRSNLRTAVDRGLSETDALAGLTTVPAKLCGVDSLLGTIEAGKLADLTVVAGDSYFNTEAKVREVWIDGRIYRNPEEEPKPKSGNADTNSPASKLEKEQPGKAKEEPEKQSKPPELAQEETKAEKPASATAESKSEKPSRKTQQERELLKTRTAHSPLEGRGPLPLSRTDPATGQPTSPDPSYHPTNIVIKNATVWLCDQKDSVVTNGYLWIQGDKIAGAGLIHLPSLPDMLVIDAHGGHVTPGIIDCHSHSAVLGSVNEGTLPSSAMVRIHDVVNSETPNLYEQLAGGVTAVNLLHGSANPIGGQNCVIKMRDGAPPEELVFKDAPEGIKFALGENVKQSNWGERFATRFPQTRMGVRTFIANRFTAARQYLSDWDTFRKWEAAGEPTGPNPMPVRPRRDLELEALGEILEGKRLIHCHSYRQDEILMLIRLMESFGVKIATFQHVLEGYKVADEIARHGAGGSTFSDWWAYKFEVYDAIPYNGSLMWERGVVVSFNSDSSELARHLYTEAAKAVKYGGTPDPEALKFVTLNPAKQLHIDKQVGSLEAGKDADFVIWSKSPLDSRTVCLQTWIDGKKYFDRSMNSERVTRLQKERTDLLAKARKLSGGGGRRDSSPADSGDEAKFFQISLEHQYDGQERHCLEDQ